MNIRVLILQSDRAAGNLDVAPAEGVAVVGHLALSAMPVSLFSGFAVEVAVLDLRGMAPADIRTCVRALRAAAAESRLIAVTDAGDEAAAQMAISAGAAAQVSRDHSPLALLRAIRSVMRGGFHLGPTGQKAIRQLLTPA